MEPVFPSLVDDKNGVFRRDIFVCDKDKRLCFLLFGGEFERVRQIFCGNALRVDKKRSRAVDGNDEACFRPFLCRRFCAWRRDAELGDVVKLHAH